MRRRHILIGLLTLIVAWAVFGISIEYFLQRETEEWSVVIEADGPRRNTVPCHLLGNCDVSNYVRDGRYVREGKLGVARDSWSVLKHSSDFDNLTNPKCFRRVHIWADERRNVGEFPCHGLPCGIRLVQDKSFDTMRKSDAVLLIHRTYWNWTEMFRVRPPNQKWIFYSQESPLNTRAGVLPPLEHCNDSYDYIMSYRTREADLYGAYGKFDMSEPTVDANDTRNWAAKKSKLVAWLASKCHSKGVFWNRFEFVKALSHFVDVDIYGECGDPYSCPRGHNAETCVDVLKKHKFYLSLENSACRDYITEKLWSNAYLNDIVPIVFGPPREDYEAVAPPNSFIHVKDFKSVKELADYLIKLDKNDHLYNQYFEWKKLGFVVSTKEDWLLEPRQMCQVVERLLVDERAVAEGTYKRRPSPNWKSWWNDSCVSDVTIDLN